MEEFKLLVQLGMVILQSEKIYFKMRNATRNKERHLMMITGKTTTTTNLAITNSGTTDKDTPKIGTKN